MSVEVTEDELTEKVGIPNAHLTRSGALRQGEAPSASNTMSLGKYNLSMKQAQTDRSQGYEETIEALRRAEQKYRSIFENATEGIFQTTPEGKYLSANPALARMYGYDTPAELLADLIDISRQLYVEPDRRWKFTLAMRNDGHIHDFESQIYRRDGTIIWISENAHAVHDELTGELLYYEGMVQDITRRKAAEEASKQAEENLVRYAKSYGLRILNSTPIWKWRATSNRFF